jgi:hypothetical protein
MSRRRRGRALTPRPPEPLDKEWALAKFRRLVGRGVTFGFVAIGLVVKAENPEQLAACLQRPS